MSSILFWDKNKHQSELKVTVSLISNDLPYKDGNTYHSDNYNMFFSAELKTLEWWISGLMLNPLFFLISRLNIACSPLIFNLQINYPIRIKNIPF